MSLLSDANTFVPHQDTAKGMSFFHQEEAGTDPLPLPKTIKDDIMGLVNAVERNIGINKFLFIGAPGTGKTETARQLSRILDRELFALDFDQVIDSKLGQTSKNISEVFQEMNTIPHPEKAIILFDEIDAIALNRIDSQDLREMGRATSSVFKGLDSIHPRLVFIATTNLFSKLDKALVRRFDSVIDFSRYDKEDLLSIADMLLAFYLSKFRQGGKDSRLLRKILSLLPSIPYPGDLKNIIRTAIAFSDPSNEYDYLARIYQTLVVPPLSMEELKKRGFTVREMEKLTAISKSQIARDLKEGETNGT